MSPLAGASTGADAIRFCVLCLLLPCSHLDYEIVIVDDNSPDRTADVARQLQKLFGEDRIVRR